MNKIFDIKKRSYLFSVEIIKFINLLDRSMSNDVLVKQLIRSSTSIGANIVEGSSAVSKREFINFFNHSLKSTKETLYWLQLLKNTNNSNLDVAELILEAQELSKIISTIIMNTKEKS